ncbi:mitochondrial pitrilysin family M16 presequence metallopeptidase [Andalucia godoyi]|uniref:Presequence protease, mitochondrial n=1 Tax=Andalucia godoyi TaxID=505711 RepID=A0A8K0AIG7_ANDGO|nr:mitochondrial pitrilysin family M16 presequence metallopeptidase [Andalucia godoyi]|eukprot:ANDGO_05139.mRNA.1 mitochondrial pitrilysin family M16 presequence metallopeptidase (Mop112 homolog)
MFRVSKVLCESRKFSVGNVVHGWRVVSIDNIPELHGLNAVQLVHERLGSLFLHLDAPDTNNVFSVTFRTPVSSNNGIPHILEHTTLCGSKKYPVRDPFFNMIKRSLNTYMNAWTAGSYTMYPFSTQNAKDFENLLSVYTDAVFFPNLEKQDFLQEGHRLEWDKSTNSFVLKGVVFNEMKGVMNDPSTLFALRMMTEMLPNTPYANYSGGDPLEIPSLTHEELVAFQQKHYHPSNARFVTYGSFGPEKTLQFLNDKIFPSFEKRLDVPSAPNAVTTFARPKILEMTGPADPLRSVSEQGVRWARSYLCCDAQDVDQSSALQVVSSLLLDGPSSPMFKALIKSGLAPDFAPMTGYDYHTRSTMLTLGVSGAQESELGMIKGVIDHTLIESADKGFDPQRVRALIHKLQLSLRKTQANFGLNLASRIMPFWVHDCNPVDLLRVNRFTEQLQKAVDHPRSRLLESLVEQYLLPNVNPHTVELLMRPDETFASKQTEKEERILREKATAADRNEVVRVQEELESRQQQKQDISCLPCISLEDVSPTVEFHTMQFSFPTRQLNSTVVFNDQPTNGIVYFSRILPVDLRCVPQSKIMMLNLFVSFLPRLGTQSFAEDELSVALDSAADSVSVGSLITNDETAFVLGASALADGSFFDSKWRKTSELLYEILESPRLDNVDRVSQMLRTMMQQLPSEISDSGSSLAMRYAAAGLSQEHEIMELTSGISYIRNAMRLGDDPTYVLSMIRDWLGSLYNAQMEALRGPANSIAVGTARSLYIGPTELLKQCAPAFSRPFSPSVSLRPDLNQELPSQVVEFKNHAYFVTPASQVEYAAGVMKTDIAYESLDSVASQVLVRILSSQYLHRLVREQGGAYGSSASFNVLNGSFGMSSFRDPNGLRSISLFQGGLAWLKQYNVTEQDLTEAKLEMFQGMDAPTVPQSRGSLAFLRGISDEQRQRRKQWIRSLVAEDVYRVADRLEGHLKKHGMRVCIFGSAEGAKKAEREGWTVEDLSMNSEV